MPSQPAPPRRTTRNTRDEIRGLHDVLGTAERSRPWGGPGTRCACAPTTDTHHRSTTPDKIHDPHHHLSPSSAQQPRPLRNPDPAPDLVPLRHERRHGDAVRLR
ncbi:hypothetical protein [Streptomyces sp. SD31]|uniref:hypothetical protein n=1 Tax=Streptomyces sp. SD31 TaxID=3452208 RepID=UPI003F8A7641